MMSGLLLPVALLAALYGVQSWPLEDDATLADANQDMNAVTTKRSQVLSQLTQVINGLRTYDRKQSSLSSLANQMHGQAAAMRNMASQANRAGRMGNYNVHRALPYRSRSRFSQFNRSPSQLSRSRSMMQYNMNPYARVRSRNQYDRLRASLSGRDRQQQEQVVTLKDSVDKSKPRPAAVGAAAAAAVNADANAAVEETAAEKVDVSKVDKSIASKVSSPAVDRLLANFQIKDFEQGGKYWTANTLQGDDDQGAGSSAAVQEMGQKTTMEDFLGLNGVSTDERSMPVAGAASKENVAASAGGTAVHNTAKAAAKPVQHTSAREDVHRAILLGSVRARNAAHVRSSVHVAKPRSGAAGRGVHRAHSAMSRAHARTGIVHRALFIGNRRAHDAARARGNVYRALLFANQRDQDAARTRSNVHRAMPDRSRNSNTDRLQQALMQRRLAQARAQDNSMDADNMAWAQERVASPAAMSEESMTSSTEDEGTSNEAAVSQESRKAVDDQEVVDNSNDISTLSDADTAREANKAFDDLMSDTTW